MKPMHTWYGYGTVKETKKEEVCFFNDLDKRDVREHNQFNAAKKEKGVRYE